MWLDASLSVTYAHVPNVALHGQYLYILMLWITSQKKFFYFSMLASLAGTDPSETWAHIAGAAPLDLPTPSKFLPFWIWIISYIYCEGANKRWWIQAPIPLASLNAERRPRPPDPSLTPIKVLLSTDSKTENQDAFIRYMKIVQWRGHTRATMRPILTTADQLFMRPISLLTWRQTRSNFLAYKYRSHGPQTRLMKIHCIERWTRTR